MDIFLGGDATPKVMRPFVDTERHVGGGGPLCRSGGPLGFPSDEPPGLWGGFTKFRYSRISNRTKVEHNGRAGSTLPKLWWCFRKHEVCAGQT